jgi:hypothetical protein
MDVAVHARITILAENGRNDWKTAIGSLMRW